jgi:hypothetical protein
MELVRRPSRMCTRISDRRAHEIYRLMRVTRLPRSALIYLLVCYALHRLGGVPSRGVFWSAVADLEQGELGAAQRQEISE